MNNKKGVKITLDKERVLRFDLNALIEVEEEYGSITEIFDELSENPSLKTIRFLIYSGLKHEDEELTENEVGSMITMQNMNGILDALTEALSESLPEVDEEENEIKN